MPYYNRLKLDLPNTCIIKEMEIAHEKLVKLQEAREQARAEALSNSLTQTARNLGIRIHCMCHDRRCVYWQSSSCRCGGHMTCREIGFLLATTNNIDERLDIELHPEFPTEAELKTAEESLSDGEKVRNEEEVFIAWKARVALRVWQIARDIHNIPEDGLTTYTYQSWRTETSEERETNFMSTIHEVRALAEPESHSYLAHVVGCFSCGRIYTNTIKLLAHMDRMRYNHDTLHPVCRIVVGDEVVTARPMPPNYTPPMPTLTHPSPPPHDSHNGIIDFLTRPREYTDGMWETLIVEDLREHHPEAVGCFRCGYIFATEDHYTTHAVDAHNMPLDEVYDWMVRVRP